MSASFKVGSWLGGVAMVAAGLVASPAAAQGTRVTAAVPASLGAIPNGFGQRDVQFAVSGTGIVRSVTVAVTMTHGRVADLSAVLIGPDGTQAPVFSWGGEALSSSVNGAYIFTDGAAGEFHAAGRGAGSGVIPPGSYRPNTSVGFVVSFAAVFGDRAGGGLWTLRFQDSLGLNAAGSITAATLTLGLVPGTAAVADAGTLGAIPDGPDTTQTPGPPRDVTFTVPGDAGVVRAVAVSIGITHTWVGDLVAQLIAPDGRQHVLFGYTGAVNAGAGSGSDLNGTYVFSDAALTGPSFWAAATVATVAPGTYATTTVGGSASGGQPASLDAAFMGSTTSGVWTLRVTDGSISDIGAITSARLWLASVAVPTTVADAVTVAYGTPLTVAAPGLLGNDQDNLGGPMTAALVSPPAHGTAAVSPSGAFTYTPHVGFVGTDTFAYRATNTDGPGNVATVTVLVPTPTTVQAPTEFRASSVSGNVVTLRWTPAFGPVATDYIVEGGVVPGQALAAIATGGPLPLLTFQAPTGVFYLRVRAVAGGQQSAPSNEIPLVVNTPAVPSAPDSLTGLVSGNSMALAWRNTFGGGSPAALVMDVTGSAVAALPLPLAETFAFAGVPGGTYTFRVRAANGSGTSLGSNPVTLTFPSGCSGPPSPATNFLAYALGNVVHLIWDPPATGPAATSYVLSVGGAFTGSVPFAVRSFITSAPSGAYTFNVVAVNACGASPATATQTVFVL